jgi:hypothetical protein
MSEMHYKLAAIQACWHTLHHTDSFAKMPPG